jgi:CheY-like chemotaxis protein
MSEDDTARLFQSFEQGDKSTTRRFGGTGLGLAICRQLARLMGGEVGVNSAPQLGSTFWFRAEFPIAQAVQVLPDPSGDQQNAIDALRGTCMLVVDDNEFNLDVARGLLEDIGVEVRTAANGALAIAMLQHGRFDCVLMDVQMPVMDGYAATRRIRADPRFKHTVIIAMTANASGSDRILCLEAGMDEVIRKPVDPAKMFRTLALGLQGAIERLAQDAAATSADTVSAFAELDARLDALPAWDSQALARMVGSSQEAQQRLLQKFLATAAQTVQEIGLATATHNWAGAAALGHKLKSSARSVGAMQLGALCDALEQDGKLGLASHCTQLAARVQQAFDNAQKHIRTEL